MARQEKQFFANVLQAVVISLVLAVIGGLWKTYLDVHDLKTKMDWLYAYTFPTGHGE